MAIDHIDKQGCLILYHPQEFIVEGTVGGCSRKLFRTMPQIWIITFNTSSLCSKELIIFVRNQLSQPPGHILTPLLWSTHRAVWSTTVRSARRHFTRHICTDLYTSVQTFFGHQAHAVRPRWSCYGTRQLHGGMSRSLRVCAAATCSVPGCGLDWTCKFTTWVFLLQMIKIFYCKHKHF